MVLRQGQSPIPFERSAEITDTEATVGDVVGLSIYGGSFVNIEVHVADATIDVFKVELKDHANGEWYTLVSSWAEAGDTILFVTGDPAALTDDTYAHAHLKVNAAFAMRFRASVASGTGTVSVRGSFRG